MKLKLEDAWFNEDHLKISPQSESSEMLRVEAFQGATSLFAERKAVILLKRREVRTLRDTLTKMLRKGKR